MNVTIVDYKSGNISSVINSFKEVAKKAIKVAADICVFTNENVKVEKI